MKERKKKTRPLGKKKLTDGARRGKNFASRVDRGGKIISTLENCPREGKRRGVPWKKERKRRREE